MMGLRGFLVGLLASMLFITSCISNAGSPEQDGDNGIATPSRECNEDAVTALLNQFIDHYNAGRASEASSLFALKDEGYGFQWYSDSTRGGQPNSSGIYDPYDRDSLEEYLAERHAAGHQLKIVSVSYAQRPRLADLGMTLQGPEGTFRGKASVDCTTMKFIVWSTGTSTSTTSASARASSRAFGRGTGRHLGDVGRLDSR